ncbi:hypothetical protein QYF61_002910 [Mycteria americana]|uniref:Integrase catalytic domain-containing protein n=1 Tax=Mycteria americana TaxID=33587 RepID=A0AAN7MI02_MYCAM|nr:hypothetical protein QYF61_002910 [Mycteria americana]
MQKLEGQTKPTTTSNKKKTSFYRADSPAETGIGNLHPGRKALPGASGRKHQGRLEVDPKGFGVGDTEDLRPAILQLKKRYWQHRKGYELLWKWLVLKHSSSWHPDCQCWAGCSKGGSPLHIMQLHVWSKWVALITKWARIAKSNHPGILEVLMDWPEGKDFRISPEEEVTRAEEAPLKASEMEVLLYGVLYDKLQKLLKEMVNRANLQKLRPSNIAEREKWPVLYLYTDSWMVANARWGWLQQWKQINWQHRGKPIWATVLWQDIAAWVENLVVKVRHVDAHVPKGQATEEHENNQQVDQAAEIEVAQLGGLMIPQAIKEEVQHKDGLVVEGWTRSWTLLHRLSMNIDYITLPQTRQGKHYVLTMVEATTGWLETYPVPHATARNTILGLEKQVLWRHGTPERIELDNRTHFRNNLIDTWAKEHSIEWIYHIPYHAPASEKIE